jgi:hypothetical protein
VLHCYKARNDTSPVPGSYEVSISQSAVEVSRVTSATKSTRVFRRAEPKSQSQVLAPVRGRSTTVFATQYGDVPAVLAGTNVFCSVVSPSPVEIVCAQASNAALSGTPTGSYGVTISNGLVRVTQATDSAGHSHTIFSKTM